MNLSINDFQGSQNKIDVFKTFSEKKNENGRDPKASGIGLKVCLVAGLAFLGIALIQGRKYLNETYTSAELIKENNNFIGTREGVMEYPLAALLFLKNSLAIRDYHYNTICPNAMCLGNEYENCLKGNNSTNKKEECLTKENKDCLVRASDNCLKEEVLVSAESNYMRTYHHDEFVCATDSTEKWKNKGILFGPEGLNLGWVNQWQFKDPANPTRVECYLYDLPYHDAHYGAGVRVGIEECSKEEKDEYRSNSETITKIQENLPKIEKDANEILEKGWNPSAATIKKYPACGQYYSTLRELLVKREAHTGPGLKSRWFESN